MENKKRKFKAWMEENHSGVRNLLILLKLLFLISTLIAAGMFYLDQANWWKFAILGVLIFVVFLLISKAKMKEFEDEVDVLKRFYEKNKKH